MRATTGGASLADSACWKGHDAGQCSSSAQCSSGDYCDPLGLVTCAVDAGPWTVFAVPNGECLPLCNQEYQQSCTVDEDCAPDLGCFRAIGINNRCSGEGNCVCT